MSRLTQEELISIAEEKDLTINNIDAYTNLKTPMSFTCHKCGKTFESDIETVRSKYFLCPCCNMQTVKYVGQPPKKKGYRIMGFDQATQHFGISIFDDGQLVYFDCIDFKGEVEERYLQIFNFVDYILKVWEPDWVEFEDIQMQPGGNGGYNAFKILGGLLGIVKVALCKNKIPHEEVLNKVWQGKFQIAGRDRATQKASVIGKVKSLFGIDVVDDVADAILIGKYAVLMKERKTLF